MRFTTDRAVALDFLTRVTAGGPVSSPGAR
jgi:hypothetical protein